MQVEIASLALHAAPAWLAPVPVLMLLPYTPLRLFGRFPRSRNHNALLSRLHITGSLKVAGSTGWPLAITASWVRNWSSPSDQVVCHLSRGRSLWTTPGSISAGLSLGAGQACARKAPQHSSAGCHPPASVHQHKHSLKGHWSVRQMWSVWQPEPVPELKTL